MNAPIRLSSRQRATAALAATITSACVLGTVLLAFDAANPTPEVPTLFARHSAALAPRPGEHGRAMADTRLRGDVAEAGSRSTQRGRNPRTQWTYRTAAGHVSE